MPPEAGAPATAWLVVGLGNPGCEYELTRHNLGFLVADRLAERNAIRMTRPECRALVGLGRVGGVEVVLAKPQTYMNLSGPSVKALAERYAVPVERLLLVYDELALPWRMLRVRPGGSSAGHHGVESVMGSLGSTGFPRLRIGVHPGRPVGDGASFVLAAFGREERKELDELLDMASQAVESIIAEGVEKAMATYNRRARGLAEEE